MHTMMPSIRQMVWTTASLHLVGTAAWDFVSEDRLKDITDKNERVLVSFIWPSEHESRAFEQEWATITAEAKVTAAVDCEKDGALCKTYDPTSHPTIKLISSGNTSQAFQGEHSAKGVLAFVNRMLKPAVTSVDPSITSEFLASDEIVTVLHLPATSEDDSCVERFTTVANSLRDRFSFGIERDSANQENKRLVCHNNMEDLQHLTKEIGGSREMEKFVAACAMPLVAELAARNELDYMMMPRSMVVHFTDDETDRKAFVESMKPLAKAHRDDLAFLTVDTNKYPEMPVALGHRVGTKRGISLQSPHATQIFVYGEGRPVTAADLEEFIEGVSSGKVEQWDRSSRTEE